MLFEAEGRAKTRMITRHENSSISRTIVVGLETEFTVSS